MRIGLKLAILTTGRSQREISADTRISENRLSEIVRGWAQPRDDERSALIRVLGCSENVFEDNGALDTRSARR